MYRHEGFNTLILLRVYGNKIMDCVKWTILIHIYGYYDLMSSSKVIGVIKYILNVFNFWSNKCTLGFYFVSPKYLICVVVLSDYEIKWSTNLKYINLFVMKELNAILYEILCLWNSSQFLHISVKFEVHVRYIEERAE